MAEATREPNGGAPAAREPEPFKGEVVIEVGDERNRRFLWSPLGVELRGRWSRVNCTGDEMVESLALIPDIPGMQIVVDCTGRNRRLEVRDPLSDPANADLAEQLRKAMKDAFRVDQVPSRTTAVENADANAVKTWLYYMRRMVNGCPIDDTQKRKSGGPQAKVLKGTLPTLEEIAKLPGKTRIEFGNQSPLAVRYLEDRKPAVYATPPGWSRRSLSRAGERSTRRDQFTTMQTPAKGICVPCGGTGKVRQETKGADGQTKVQILTCPLCNGSGRGGYRTK